VDVTFPTDPYLMPFMTLETAGLQSNPKAPTLVTEALLKDARLIATPEERSLALQRIANGAIASNQLILAHHTLEEATTVTSDVKVPLVRDQRLIALVRTLMFLTEAFLREGHLIIEPLDSSPRPEALPKRIDSQVAIRTARLEWKRGVYLADLIGNPTYRNEMLYRVAENEASGSATIANEYVRPLEIESPGRELTTPGGVPKPELTPKQIEDRRRQREAENESYRKVADVILADSAEVTKKIDRLIWKYRGMVRIALLAADSGQFARGFNVASKIENAEARAEAMLLLAEAQARRKQDAGATASYEQAARAVSMVPQDGLRGVLAGFLIDSLITTGRFDDARKCIVLYPEQAQRMVALELIAQSQGQRGAAESARQWIAREVPEQFRPILYRRVVTGELTATEQNRSAEQMRTEETSPIPFRVN
jgi:hypothetical protein